MALSSRHCRTLQAIFRQPTAADIDWGDFALLVTALGGDVEPGSGSRRRMMLRGVVAVFHKPHPRPEMMKNSADSAREFLLKARVTPRSEGCA